MQPLLACSQLIYQSHGDEGSSVLMTHSPVRMATVIKTIRAYDDKEWEIFIREWMAGLKMRYHEVKRFGAGGDKGRDVVAFTDSRKFEGVWDNCQCKHFEQPLSVTKALIDIAKIVYHSYDKSFRVPRRSDFLAPKGVSMELQDLLGNPTQLRDTVIGRWNTSCAGNLVSGQRFKLAGDLGDFVSNFDYSVFGWKTLDEVLDDYRATAYWSERFGGLLPQAPLGAVPAEIAASESVYIRHLLDAYEERLGIWLSTVEDLSADEHLSGDLVEQRVRFYDAEAFVGFYRDQTEPGTTESFQRDIFDVAREVMNRKYTDGVERLSAAMELSASTTPSGLLGPYSRPRVRQGVCHQLANEDKLRWRRK